MQSVFGTRSAGQGGVPGEILLHIVCRQVFGSDTVVNKVFFKTGVNDEVKGFDAVHIVDTPDGLELWLGEAKFYTSRNDAIRDALASSASTCRPTTSSPSSASSPPRSMTHGLTPGRSGS